MRGYFDDEEAEREELEEAPHDTEVTLTWGAVLGMGAALLLLCGLCFGLGYVVGHRGSGRAAATAQTAPDQEPLQGSGSVPKPSASAQAAIPAPAPAPAPASQSSTPPPAQGGESPEAVAASPSQGTPAQGTQSGAPGGSPAATAPAPAQVHPALGANTPETAAPAATNMRPALPAAGSLMVQVAAVKNAVDAGVLMSALRRRGYPVNDQRDAGDGLIHVRVGPFASRQEAYRWRDKLLGDGYNAIVQP